MPRRTTNTLNFTKTAIEKLESPEGNRIYHYDDKIRGLAVCVTPVGTKTFYVVRRVDNSTEFIRIGSYPEYSVEQARTEASKINGSVASGVNPNDRRRVNRYAPTLGQIFSEYIEKPTRGKAKRTRSAKTVKDYRWQFSKYLAPWRDRQLSKIKRQDVERLHNEIGEAGGQYMANRVLALVKAVLNYAVECEYFPVNVATRLRAFEEQSRERFLTAEELPRFWQAVEVEVAADFFKLSLLTGARRSNVLAARWDQIDFAVNTWRIPTTKSGQPLTLPLSLPALDLLKKRKAASRGPWVFPNQDDTGPMPTPRHGWERILEAAGIKDLRLHDLRRSLGSWQAMNGTSETVIGKSLGHASIQATKVYARVDLETVRSSVNDATAAILKAAQPKKKQRKS